MALSAVAGALINWLHVYHFSKDLPVLSCRCCHRHSVEGKRCTNLVQQAYPVSYGALNAYINAIFSVNIQHWFIILAFWNSFIICLFKLFLYSVAYFQFLSGEAKVQHNSEFMPTNQNRQNSYAVIGIEDDRATNTEQLIQMLLNHDMVAMQHFD